VWTPGGPNAAHPHRVRPGGPVGLATGTPAGVGMGFDPPRWLRRGDAVRIQFDGIGVLENRVI
jgi:2-keto-4-pentenoate hydratase/2-oxohepta-3-ene-1,7-dioic acid hydratase in catechol pathway